MNTLLISDTQFGNHQEFATVHDGFNTRFLMQLSAIVNAIGYAKSEYSIGRVIHCGDFFHVRGEVQVDVLNATMDMVRDSDVEWVIVGGNHDFGIMTHYHSTVRPFDFMKQVNVHLVAYYEDTRSELYIPYRNDMSEWMEECNDLLAGEDKSKVTVFMHGYMDGFQYIGNFPTKGGIPLSFLRKFRRVYAGHVHQPQTKGKFTSIGSPYNTSFDDTGIRICYVLNEKNDVIAEFSTNHPRFIVTNKTSVPNDGNFYLVETDDRNVKSTSNSRVKARKIEVTSKSPFKVSTDLVSSYKEYCKHVGRMDVVSEAESIIKEAKK